MGGRVGAVYGHKNVAAIGGVFWELWCLGFLPSLCPVKLLQWVLLEKLTLLAHIWAFLVSCSSILSGRTFVLRSPSSYLIQWS